MFIFYTLMMTLALLPLWFVVRFWMAHQLRVSALVKWCLSLSLVSMVVFYLPAYAQQPSRTGVETSAPESGAAEPRRTATADTEGGGEAGIVVAGRATGQEPVA
ncbi:MAG: hypothetical protein MK364_14070, partial [Pirellulales bacterium]|nr:hypothetical protein [Pirellulales bacterium]